MAAILSAGLARTGHACEECKLRKEGTVLGQFTILGNGTVRTWAKLNKQGKPQAIGVTFSENALAGLPETGAGPPDMPSVMHELALPKEALITGFDHIGLDWNPKGHVPKGVYNVPHFDVHFYRVPVRELAQITAMGKDLARCERQPAKQYMPAGYILPPGTSVPGMGAHALDASSPELHGQPFTQTFMHGFYNGNLIFLEPMVAKSFLETKPNVVTPVKLPKAYARKGFYPTRYRISYDPVRKEYTVALEGLTWRPGAQKMEARR